MNNNKLNNFSDPKWNKVVLRVLFLIKIIQVKQYYVEPSQKEKLLNNTNQIRSRFALAFQ